MEASHFTDASRGPEILAVKVDRDGSSVSDDQLQQLIIEEFLTLTLSDLPFEDRGPVRTADLDPGDRIDSLEFDGHALDCRSDRGSLIVGFEDILSNRDNGIRSLR